MLLYFQSFLWRFTWGRKLVQAYFVRQLKDPARKQLLRAALAELEQRRKSGMPPEPEVIDLCAIPLDAPPQVTIHPFGMVTIDGTGASLVREDGIEAFHGRDGQQVMSAPAHMRIEIVDTDQVLNHKTIRVFNTTSHVIHFVRGGTLAYMVDAEKGRIEMQLDKVEINLETPGVMRVSV